MKVKHIINHLLGINQEQEIVISWFTREDAESWLDEKISDTVWEHMLNDLGFDEDDIRYSHQTGKEYEKEIENTKSVSR